MIVVDLTVPSAAPVLTSEPHRNVVPVFVFSAVGRDVRDVIVDGRLVVRDRRSRTLDEDVVGECPQRARRILATM